jgi:diadenosine tetraphosphate (Ap4A) HIT family hydrolase
MVVEGLEIDHAHVKLYPYRNGDSKFSGLGIKTGDKKPVEELQKVANKIKGNNK